MNFTVTTGDVDRAIRIMKEVAAWGRSLGYRVWLDEWLSKEDLLTDGVEEENFCVGTVDGVDACTMILQWVDPEFWPDAPPNEAGYIHKLCVRRDYAGKQLSAKMVEYAKEQCRIRGAKYLRLDTGWDEEKMKEIYTGLGFEIVKKLEFKNGKAMALYELKIEG